MRQKNILYLKFQVFFGGLKKMKIQRLVLVGEEKAATELREKILTIHVKPGLPSGTKIIFPEEGDQGPTKIPGINFSFWKILSILKNHYHL